MACVASTRSALALGVLMMTASAALAAPATHELSAGVVTSRYDSFVRSTRDHLLLELLYQRQLGDEGLRSALVVGGGIRGGMVSTSETRFVRVPLEAFASLQLRARMGWWEAAVGPEVGVSGFARLLVPPKPFPTLGGASEEQARLNPVYLGMKVAPLRVRLGRVMASALEVQLATSSWKGSAIRLDVGLLRLGVAL